jgi:hypothetical protein
MVKGYNVCRKAASLDQSGMPAKNYHTWPKIVVDNDDEKGTKRKFNNAVVKTAALPHQGFRKPLQSPCRGSIGRVWVSFGALDPFLSTDTAARADALPRDGKRRNFFEDCAQARGYGESEGMIPISVRRQVGVKGYFFLNFLKLPLFLCFLKFFFFPLKSVSNS